MEAGGRRIKRAIYIDVTSMKFYNDEMLNRLGKAFNVFTNTLRTKEKKLLNIIKPVI